MNTELMGLGTGLAWAVLGLVALKVVIGIIEPKPLPGAVLGFWIIFFSFQFMIQFVDFDVPNANRFLLPMMAGFLAIVIAVTLLEEWARKLTEEQKC